MRALGACSPLSSSMPAWPPALPLANEPGAAGNDGREAGCPHHRRRYGDRRLRKRETGGREMMSGSAAPEPGHRSGARPRRKRRCARHGRPRSACSPSCSAPPEKAALRAWKGKIGRIYRRFLVDGVDLRAGGPAGAAGWFRMVTVTFAMCSAAADPGAGRAPVRAVCRLPGRDPHRRPPAVVTFTNPRLCPRLDSNLRSRLRRASLSVAASCGHMASPTSLGRIQGGKCARRGAPNTRSASYPVGFPAW
jgi:hypothetical protein